MTPRALLLDLDGTLVDTEPLNRAAYRAFFAGRGWDEPDLALFVGRRAADVFATEPGPWSKLDPAELAAEVIALIDPDAVPDPLPGAAALLDAADRLRLPVAIVTSADLAWVHRFATGPLAALDRAAVLVTGEEIVDGKPDPTGYLLACERLGVAPAEALAVEDSPAGVRAAVTAGVGTVVAVTTTHEAAALEVAGADPVVPQLGTVLELLDPGD